ncbi:MAG TPA: hypothetical protein VG148_05480 [Pyrinomonadaceae bacterium]|nr:hypothetical protein [Pyrinomonadaceae bacterium]
MNIFKVLLALVVLFLAALGAFAVFGLVAALFKYLVFFGVILLVGAVAYKALKKDDRGYEYQLGNDPESELARADRLLEEMRRKQLTK